MLRIRIFVTPVHTSDRRLIWDRLVSAKAKSNALKQLRAVDESSDLLGEILSFRFGDGEGGGCQVEGAFLEMELNETPEMVEARLEMSPQSIRDWRVW